jgi:vitamin B12 transporter
MAGYVRFDLLTDYKVNQQLSLFARGENLTNARYEDARNYGTAGRSVYAGLKYTW